MEHFYLDNKAHATNSGFMGGIVEVESSMDASPGRMETLVDTQKV